MRNRVENCGTMAASRHPLTERYDKRRYVAEQEADGTDERPQRQPVRARFARPFRLQIRLTRIANEIQNRYRQGTLRRDSENSKDSVARRARRRNEIKCIARQIKKKRQTLFAILLTRSQLKRKVKSG